MLSHVEYNILACTNLRKYVYVRVTFELSLVQANHYIFVANFHPNLVCVISYIELEGLIVPSGFFASVLRNRSLFRRLSANNNNYLHNLNVVRFTYL